MTLRPPAGRSFPDEAVPARPPLQPFASKLVVRVGSVVAKVRAWTPSAIEIEAPSGVSGGNVWIGPERQFSLPGLALGSCLQRRALFARVEGLGPGTRPSSPFAGADIVKGHVAGSSEIVLGEGPSRISSLDFRQLVTIPTGGMGRIVMKPVPCVPELSDQSVCVPAPSGSGCANELDLADAPRIRRFQADEGWPATTSGAVPEPFVQTVVGSTATLRWAVDPDPSASATVTLAPDTMPGRPPAGTASVDLRSNRTFKLEGRNRCGTATRTVVLRSDNLLSTSAEEVRLAPGTSADITLQLLDPAPSTGVRVSLTGGNAEVSVTGSGVFAGGATSTTMTIAAAPGVAGDRLVPRATLLPSISTANVSADFISIRVFVDPAATQLPVLPGHDLRGCFKYHDGSTARELSDTNAEVWAYRPRPIVWTWAVERAFVTDGRGCFQTSFAFPKDTFYTVRIFAENDAAKVAQQDLPGTRFYAESHHLWATKPDQPLDFSRTFNDPTNTTRDQPFELWIAGHFNLATKARVARRLAGSLRSSAGRDPIGVVAFAPHRGAPGINYQRFGVIWLHFDRWMNDRQIMHEYGHFLQEQISRFHGLGAVWSACTAALGDNERAAHAWQEGFADWFSNTARLLRPTETNMPVSNLPAACATNAPGCPATPRNGAPRSVWFALDVLQGSLANVAAPTCPTATVNCAGQTCVDAARSIFQVFDETMDADVAGSPDATSDGFVQAWRSRGNSPKIDAAWTAAGLQLP